MHRFLPMLVLLSACAGEEGMSPEDQDTPETTKGAGSGDADSDGLCDAGDERSYTFSRNGEEFQAEAFALRTADGPVKFGSITLSPLGVGAVSINDAELSGKEVDAGDLDVEAMGEATVKQSIGWVTIDNISGYADGAIVEVSGHSSAGLGWDVEGCESERDELGFSSSFVLADGSTGDVQVDVSPGDEDAVMELSIDGKDVDSDGLCDLVFWDDEGRVYEEEVGCGEALKVVVVGTPRPTFRDLHYTNANPRPIITTIGYAAMHYE